MTTLPIIKPKTNEPASTYALDVGSIDLSSGGGQSSAGAPMSIIPSAPMTIAPKPSSPSVIDVIRGGGTKFGKPSDVIDVIKSGGSKGFPGGGGGGGSPPPTSPGAPGGGGAGAIPEPKTDVDKFNENLAKRNDALKNLHKGATDVQKFNAIQKFNKSLREGSESTPLEEEKKMSLLPELRNQPIGFDIGQQGQLFQKSISKYKSFSKEEIAESKFYENVYNEKQSNFFSKATQPFISLGRYTSKFSKLLFGEKQAPGFKTAFTPIMSTALPGVGRKGTAMFDMPKDFQLNEENLLFKRTIQEEIPLQFKLSKIEYTSGFETRMQQREQKIYEERHPYESKVNNLIPNIKYEPYKIEKRLYEMGLPSKAIRPIVGSGSFAVGAYEGIKKHPIKTTLTFGAATLVNPSLKIGSLFVKSVGFASKTNILKPLASISKYSLGTVYGASIVGRTALTPGYYEKYGELGKITSTEILPFGAGFKFGAYGVRRYESIAELKQMEAGLMPHEKLLFQSQLKEAKAYSGIQPKVKELNFEEIEYIPPKAAPIMSEFIQKRKGSLIVGGSVAEQTQLYVEPLAKPHDVDFYVKGLAEGYKSSKYTKQLAKALELGGIERVSIPPNLPTQITISGKKAIEFHPYKEYLRSNIEQVLPWYKTANWGITKTPSGVKIPKQSVQWQRMLIRGYFEKPEAIARAFRIKGSMMASARIQTVGRNVYQVPVIEKTAYGETLGLTSFKVNKIVEKIHPFIKDLPGLRIIEAPFLKPVSIHLKKSLPFIEKVGVYSHELIHAMHPSWTELEVRQVAGAGKIEKGILMEIPKSLNIARYTELRGEGKGFNNFEYPSYKSKKILKGTPLFSKPYKPKLKYPNVTPVKPFLYKPKKNEEPLISLPYKPNKEFSLNFPYKPKKEKSIYSPYKPNLPKPYTRNKRGGTNEEKKIYSFKLPKLKYEEPLKPRITGPRAYKRRPSLVSAALGLKSTKPGKMEFTGLVARELISPKRKKKRR